MSVMSNIWLEGFWFLSYFKSVFTNGTKKVLCKLILLEIR